MVYLHFPQHLTNEEDMLQKKYAKLRRKKKALAAMKAPKQEPQPAEVEQKTKQKGIEAAADATAQAKKLLKSGVIKLESGRKEQTFKRTKRSKVEDKSNVAFQPFSPTQSSDNEDDRPNDEKRPKIKGLYESFISVRDKESKADSEDRHEKLHHRLPEKGNTIYVRGHGITEEIVQRALTNFGTIINVNMEKEKNCGFVTFEKMESAEKAITEVDGSMVAEVQLRVSMARRQPTFDTTGDPSSTSWSTIAASHSQKGASHKENRDLVKYDDADIF